MSAPRPGQGSASRYHDRHFDRTALKILPGEFYATDADEVIVTVLGSCVAACLMDPVALVGGMNHFMLPINKSIEERDIWYAARYGVGAMELLINALLRQGAHRDRLVAKTFGGGKVMRGLGDVGSQNIDFVRRFLAQEDIPCWAEDLGGLHPRKVYFFPHSGQVLVKRLEHLHNDTITTRESRYFERLVQAPDGGDVELFT
jgi:chemotaxis protein CheD